MLNYKCLTGDCFGVINTIFLSFNLKSTKIQEILENKSPVAGMERKIAVVSGASYGIGTSK
jgi:hypothetical protein